MQYENYKLKNGANVFLIPLENTKAVTTLVMYPVGSRYEDEKMAGVSHFIEHLMFKGTKKRPNTLTLTREIDRLGANYNAFTSKEYTGYYIKADSKYSEVALDILSDMLFNSKFEAVEMQKEKGVVVEEIRMYKDNPLMNIGNVFEELMYKTPLGRDIAGSEKTVLSYTRGDVLKFRNKYYCPSNMTVVVAGNINEEVRKNLNKYFGRKKKSGGVSKIFKSAEFGPKKKEDRIRIEYKKTDQVQMMLGWPGFKHNFKGNPAMSVLNTILGGSMSSRLFIEVREKRGLAYMVRSGTDNYRDTGYAYVRVGLEAKNINKAITVIKKELKKIITKGVTKRELEDAKTHIRGGLTLSLEDSSTQASYYAHQALFVDKIKTPEERLKEIEKVKNEDIMRLAKRVYRDSEMRVAVIGDVESGVVKF